MTSDSSIRQLQDAATLDATLTGGPVLLFKHSLICPISTRAFGEYRRFLATNESVETAWIDVIGGRPLSQSVEAQTGIQHESPQALLIKAGAVLWHASHGAITESRLRQAWDEYAGRWFEGLSEAPLADSARRATVSVSASCRAGYYSLRVCSEETQGGAAARRQR